MKILTNKNISTSIKISEYLQNATTTMLLKTQKTFSNPKKLNILLHNTRSFKKYFKTLNQKKNNTRATN